MKLNLLRTEDCPHLPFISTVEEMDVIVSLCANNGAREAKLWEKIVDVRKRIAMALALPKDVPQVGVGWKNEGEPHIHPNEGGNSH